MKMIHSPLRSIVGPAFLMAVVGCQEEVTAPSTETGPSELTAAAATAPLSLRQVTAADRFSCGLTTDNRAFCWGANSGGNLGSGIVSNEEHTPVAVAGGLRFRQLASGYRCT